MTALTPRARINLQRRLYDVWMEHLMGAVELGERGGPDGDLAQVLDYVETAQAAIRTAMAASAAPGAAASR